jgi:ABC-type multidrug transport system fused ATPase/permease subunit
MSFIQTINTIYLILKALKERKIFVNKILLFISSVLELASISFVIPIFDILTGRDNKLLDTFSLDYSKSQIFFILMILLIFFFFIKSLIITLINYRVYKFCFNSQEKLSLKLFKTFLNQNYDFHVNRNSADLIRTIATESRLFAFILMYYFSFFSEIFVFILVILFLFYLYPLATFVSIIISILLVIIFYKLIKNRSINLSLKKVSNEELYLKYAQETFGNIKTIKMHLKENYFIDRFFDKIKISSRATLLQNFYSSIPRMWIEFFAVITLVSALSVHIGFSKLSLIESLSIIALYAAASFKIIPSTTKLMFIIQFMFNSSASIDLVFKELKNLKLDLNEKPENNFSKKNLFNFKDKIQIFNLKFKFATRKDILFENLSFDIKKNKFIGLRGSSGTGKSTLVDILCGIRKPQSGEIKIDGIDIYSSINEWRKKVALVSQSTTLLDENLKKNITFGENEKFLDSKKLDKVIEMSNLKEFVNSLPEGIETNIGEKGLKISGGQIQRIGIARALYLDPEILILDEPTSSLDEKTEQEIYKTIQNLRGQVTVLIISHKRNIDEICDEVYILKNKSLHLDK